MPEYERMSSAHRPVALWGAARAGVEMTSSRTNEDPDRHQATKQYYSITIQYSFGTHGDDILLKPCHANLSTLLPCYELFFKKKKFSEICQNINNQNK